MSGKSSEKIQIAGVSGEALAAKTGKDWKAWFAILDDFNATGKSHKEIATFLREKHRVSAWWSQKITVGYEQSRGMREKHQRPEGYEISRSKTVSASADRLFTAWADENQRKQWLPVILELGDIRLRNPGKNIRFDYPNPESIVEAAFYEKSPEKCRVTVQHYKLPDSARAEEMKNLWAAALAALKAFAEQEKSDG